LSATIEIAAEREVISAQGSFEDLFAGADDRG
jgi:hypothetical protein